MKDAPKTKSQVAKSGSASMKSPKAEKAAVPADGPDTHVAEVFKTAYPNREAVQGYDGHMEDASPEFQDWRSWVPVTAFRTSRLSPQSGKVCDALTVYYNGIDNAWTDGWRWMLTKNNHQWFPPQYVYASATCTNPALADLAEAIKAASRKGKNQMSISSANVVAILKLMDDLRVKSLF